MSLLAPKGPKEEDPKAAQAKIASQQEQAARFVANQEQNRGLRLLQIQSGIKP